MKQFFFKKGKLVYLLLQKKILIPPSQAKLLLDLIFPKMLMSVQQCCNDALKTLLRNYTLVHSQHELDQGYVPNMGLVRKSL